MYPGEVDGFTLFAGGEAEAGQGMVRGRAFNASSGGEIPAWLWKRDGTKPGTSRQHQGSFQRRSPRLLFWGEINLVQNQRHSQV